MKWYNVLILSAVVAAGSYALGARSFHPAVMVRHVYVFDDLRRCQGQGGTLKISGGVALCDKTTEETFFSNPINADYFETLDK